MTTTTNTEFAADVANKIRIVTANRDRYIRVNCTPLTTEIDKLVSRNYPASEIGPHRRIAQARENLANHQKRVDAMNARIAAWSEVAAIGYQGESVEDIANRPYGQGRLAGDQD